MVHCQFWYAEDLAYGFILFYFSQQSTSGHLGGAYLTHHHSKLYGSQVKDLPPSPHSVSGPRNGFFCKVLIFLEVLKFMIAMQNFVKLREC